MKLDMTDWRLALDRLQNEKETQCISIVTASHLFSSRNRVNNYVIQKLIEDVKEQMLQRDANLETDRLLFSLEELAKEVSYRHGDKGIGLYVSKNMKQWLPFYFPVNEKIVVGNTFDTKDLLYQDYYAVPYHVLLLSKNGARLLTGLFDQLGEVKDDHFPMQFEDDYEYSRPSRGLTYEGHAITKDFEREKSQLKEVREDRFMQQVDDHLRFYMEEADPLIVYGTGKEFASFMDVTSQSNLVGHLHGNYFHLTVPVLGESTWSIFKTWLQSRKQQLVDELIEREGRGTAVSGIVDSWQAAYVGQGAKLFVERDFSSAGYQSGTYPDRLYPEPPDGSYKVLPDAVSSLITLVKEKGGEVVLMDESDLKQFQHVALFVRY